MSKTFFLILFLSFSLYAKDDAFWDYQERFKLKKDEIGKVLIDYRDKSLVQKEQRKFIFRWTLFQNKRLVTLIKYMNFPHQYILRKERGLDSLEFKLIPDADKVDQKTYLFFVFEDFDEKNKIATFDLFIKDSQKRILIKLEKPET